MIKIEPSVYTHFNNMEKNDCSITLLSVSLLHFTPDTLIRHTFSNAYHLIYVTKGYLGLEIDKELIVLEKGSIIMVAPFTSFTGIDIQPMLRKKRIHPDPPVFYVLDFNCDNFIFFSFEKYLKIQKAETIESTLMELYVKYSKYSDDYYVYDAFLLQLIHIIQKLMRGTSEQQLIAEQLRDYIIQNIMQPISVNELSNIFGYNKDYIGRIFKAEFNITIKNYINNEKISLAKKLLRTSEMPVASIAQFIGWEDTNLFFKYFKYHEGVSPTQYRENTIL